MAYLIIPIVCFLLLAGFVWVTFGPETFMRESVRRGRLDDLDVILSVLMTASSAEPRLLMKVPRRVTSLKMTFGDSVARVEMPLVTQRQQSLKESYLDCLRDLQLDPRTSSGGEHEVLEWEVEGPPAEVSAVIKDAFLRLFEVEPDRVLQYRVFAHFSDQYAIDQGLERRRSGKETKLPTAATKDYRPESSEEARAGCLKGLAGVFLLPAPFVIAYLQFGLVAASAVLISILIIRAAYRRWKKPKAGIRLADFLTVGILSLTAATIHFHDPLYLQLVPTIVLAALAIAELLGISFNLPHLSLSGQAKSECSTRTSRNLLSFSIVTTCAGAAALNEYLRANVTLDAWIWIFAFFRIELVLGFLVTSMPLFYYMVMQSSTAESDTESS